jgi:excisionase family DNA binding protein
MKKDHEWYFADSPLGSREWPVTTRQLANYLQVTTQTLANWRASGRIPYWRMTARAFRYNLSEVERALAKPDVEE